MTLTKVSKTPEERPDVLPLDVPPIDEETKQMWKGKDDVMSDPHFAKYVERARRNAKPPDERPVEITFQNPEVLDEMEDDEEVALMQEGDSISFLPLKLNLAMECPIDTITEKQKLYVVTKQIAFQLFQRSKPGKPHPQLLGYLKEMSGQLDSLHKFTEPVQDEVQITKLKITKMMLESREELSDEFKILMLKEMKNKQQARESLLAQQ